MKIHKSIYKLIFIVFLLLQILIVSIEFQFLLALVGCSILAFDPNVKLSKSLTNILQFLIFIAFVAILVGIFQKVPTYDKIKDIVHITKPTLVILLGFLLTQKIKNKEFIIKSILFVGVTFSILHFHKLIFATYKNFSVNEIRNNGGRIDNFIEMFAFFILINSKKIPLFNVIKTSLYKKILIFIIFISFVLYFSRTMFLGLFLFTISLYGYTKLTKKSIKILFSLFLVIVAFYSYLFTLDISMDDKGIDYFLFKIRNAPGEVFYAPDYTNYKDQKNVFKHWRAFEAKQAVEQMSVTQYFFGKGIGSLVDLKFYAPIGGKNGLRFIPHLHNGYVYVFFKAGLIGLIAYLIMISNIYKKVYSVNNTKDKEYLAKMISAFGLYFVFTSIIITGIYNLSEISTFFLGVFYCLHFNEK